MQRAVAQRSPATPSGGPEPADVPADLFGRYELSHQIGAGGMATVHLGRLHGAAGFARLVAIKCCQPHLQGDAHFATMFLDEARLAARIHHPNVIATLDMGDAPRLHMVMEYVEGGSLADLLPREIPPVDVAVRIVLDTLAGLHAAHELRDDEGVPLDLVHRDVTPQNVMVGTDGVARITDFGIAKAAARATVTRGAELKGKLGYLSPEQLARRAVDRRTDVYAAGIVLWEALTGVRLFRGATDAETFAEMLTGDVPPPSTVRDASPVALDAVVLRALARDPAARYATAAALAAAIEQVAGVGATSRDVGAYVEATLADALATRRGLVQSFRRGTFAAGTVTTQVVDVATEVDAPTHAGVTRVANPARRHTTRTRLLVALSALGIGGVALGIAARSDHGPARVHTARTAVDPPAALPSVVTRSLPFVPPPPVIVLPAQPAVSSHPVPLVHAARAAHRTVARPHAHLAAPVVAAPAPARPPSPAHELSPDSI